MSQDDAELNQLKEDLQEMGHAIEILSQKMAGSEKMIQTLQKRKDSTVEIKKIEGKLVKIEEGFDERLDDITRDFSGRALSSSFRIKNLEKSLETCDKTNNDLKSSLKELEGKMEAAGKQFMNLILALQKKQAACCKSLASQ